MSYANTISQSFLKAYLEYAEGRECGLRFEALYIKKTIIFEPSEAMRLGKYFEYKATGYHHPDEDVPQPERTKKGELTAAYQRADMQAMNFCDYIIAMGIDIVAVGERIVKDNCSLVLDIRAMYKGREVIIDLKYTGKLYDKWDEGGWDLSAFEFKTKHHHQPIHYQYMTGLPFYYFAFSSTNDIDAEFFEVILQQPETNEIHAARIQNIRESIGVEMITGFIPRPALRRCAVCELYSTCSVRQSAPVPKEVYIQTTYNQTLDK